MAQVKQYKVVNFYRRTGINRRVAGRTCGMLGVEMTTAALVTMMHAAQADQQG